MYIQEFDSFAKKYGSNSKENILINNADETLNTTKCDTSTISQTDGIKHLKIDRHSKEGHKMYHLDKYASIFFFFVFYLRKMNIMKIFVVFFFRLLTPQSLKTMNVK